MAFHEIARHETDEGELIIGHEGHRGEYVAVLDALGGRELTVDFSDVEVESRRLVFKYNAYIDRPPHEIASLEGTPETFGDVETFLRAVRAANAKRVERPMSMDAAQVVLEDD